MYDWNENNLSKGEYIADKTHWLTIEYGAPICGGNQLTPQDALVIRDKAREVNPRIGQLWYTERDGDCGIHDIGAENVKTYGPSYIEALLIYNTQEDCFDGGYYHVTEVFVNDSGWNFKDSNRSLLEVFAGDDRDVYIGSCPGVHIKKNELFQNNNQFITYCNGRLGEIDSTNGPTEEQRQIAKEILDEFAYRVCGGWLYVGIDPETNKPITCLTNPSETWKTYFNWSGYSPGVLGKLYYETIQNRITNFSQSLYTVRGIMYNSQDANWGDMGETGLATCDLKTYHKLNIRYLPEEYRQMLIDVNKYMNIGSSDSHVA